MKLDVKKELTPEIIAEYYRSKFPMNKFLEFIGLSNFSFREIGFVVSDERFIRNISFPTSAHLRDFMAKNAVRHAYVGAVYDKPPSKKNPIQKIKWKYREFIFDIDIDEYDLVRTCGCRGDQYCLDCWSLVQDAVKFLDETMKEDFGFEKIIWIFSGRRGVHGWVLDHEAKFLDQKQRVAILDYLTMIKDEKRTQSLDDIPNEAKPLRNRIYSQIARSFLARAKPKELKELGLSLNKAREIIRTVRQRTEFNHNVYNLLIPSSTVIRKNLAKEIVLRRYPRIDRKVTMDTRRVSRMPFSIHGKTGKIAQIIDDIDKFNPDLATTVWDLVN